MTFMGVFWGEFQPESYGLNGWAEFHGGDPKNPILQTEPKRNLPVSCASWRVLRVVLHVQYCWWMYLGMQWWFDDFCNGQWWWFVRGNPPPFKCARVDQLPLFPYNRGWEKSTQFRRGLYTHYKDSVIKGGRSPIPKKTRLLTMAQMPPRLSGLGICDLPRVSFLGNDLSATEVKGSHWGVT